MERPRYLEDYEIGESRETYGRTITETDFVVHAGHTGDFFPHHMDAEFMAKSEFGGRIAERHLARLNASQECIRLRWPERR